MSESRSVSDHSQDMSEGATASHVKVSQYDSMDRLNSNLKNEVTSEALPSRLRTKKKKHYKNLRILSTESIYNRSCYDYRNLMNKVKNPSRCWRSKKKDIIRENKKQIRSLSAKNAHISNQDIPFAKSRLSLKPKPKPKKTINYEAKFFEFQKNKYRKINAKKEQSERNEMLECSFRPKTNESDTSFCRFEQYYPHFSNFQKYKEENLEFLKEFYKPTQPYYSFIPEICEKSYKISLKHSYFNQSCHERLYDYFRFMRYKKVIDGSRSLISSRNTEPEYRFYPKLNKRSIEIVRTKSYKCMAQEINSKKADCAQIDSNFEASKKSMSILISKFLTEFRETAQAIDPDTSGKVNYTQFSKFCSKMFYCSKTSEETALIIYLWNKMNPSYGKVKLEDLKIAFMGIMGYYKPWMKRDSGFSLNKRKVQVFHHEFSLLSNNRTANCFKDSTPTIYENFHTDESLSEKNYYSKKNSEKLDSLSAPTEHPTNVPIDSNHDGICRSIRIAGLNIYQINQYPIKYPSSDSPVCINERK